MIRLFSRPVAAAGAFVLLAGVAMAQQPAPPAGPQPTPAQVALASEIVVHAGVENSFDAVMEPVIEQIRRAGAARPDIRKDLEEVLESLKPEMELHKKQMVANTARHYVAQFSEAELREIGAFFKSATGRKYIEAQPKLTEAIVKEMTPWSKEVSEYLLIRTRGEMSKRGHRL